MAEAAKVSPSANTLREYETIYLLQQDMTTEQTDRIKERVRGIVDREGGRVIKFTTWGRKKTAFLVGDKQARAIYVHMNYLGEGKTVAEVERNLRNLEEILKYQTIKVSDAVLPESRPTEEDEILEGDREEAPRDERGDRRDERGERREERGERREEREERREAAPAAAAPAAAPAQEEKKEEPASEASES